MSIEDADEILQDDIREISGLIAHFNSTKNFNSLLQIAQKTSSLADLYYDALEDFNVRFFEYKLMSSDYYNKISKATKSAEVRLNSTLLSILLLLQASKPESAEKKLNLLRKKQSLKKKNTEINDDWLYIIELLTIPSIKEAKKRLRHFKVEMDVALYKVFEKTIEILEKFD